MWVSTGFTDMYHQFQAHVDARAVFRPTVLQSYDSVNIDSYMRYVRVLLVFRDIADMTCSIIYDTIHDAQSFGITMDTGGYLWVRLRDQAP